MKKNTESIQDQTSLESNTNPTVITKQNLLQVPESFYRETFIERVQNPLWICNNVSLKFFCYSKLKLKINVEDCNIKEESKLQIKLYGNKNWNVISSYNN